MSDIWYIIRMSRTIDRFTALGNSARSPDKVNDPSKPQRERERERGGEKKIDGERVRETKNVRHIRHGLLLLL